MLKSDLCDYRNAYILVKGKVTVNFNPRKVYGDNQFPDELFPNIIFPNESTAEQINTARAVAKTATFNNANNHDTRDLAKGIFLRNNFPFTNCLLEINNVLIDNSEELHVEMPMYNLLEYTVNYEKTTGNFWNYYRDEPTIDDEINQYLKSKFFDYISSVIGRL